MIKLVVDDYHHLFLKLLLLKLIVGAVVIVIVIIIMIIIIKLPKFYIWYFSIVLTKCLEYSQVGGNKEHNLNIEGLMEIL